MSQPRLRAARSELGKLLNDHEDAHRGDLADITHGRFSTRAAVEKWRQAVTDNERRGAEQDGTGATKPQRWTSLEQPAKAKRRGTLPPIVPNAKESSEYWEDAGLPTVLQYDYLSGMLGQGMAMSHLNDAGSAALAHPQELMGLDASARSPAAKQRTVYLKDDGTVRERSRNRDRNVKPLSKQMPGGKKTGNETFHGGIHMASLATPVSSLPESLDSLQATRGGMHESAQSFSSAGRSLSSVGGVYRDDPLSSLARELRGEDELLSRPQPATQSRLPESRQCSDWARVLQDLDHRLMQLGIEEERNRAHIIPMSKVDLYHAARRRHERISHVKWKGDNTKWEAIAKASEELGMYDKLLQARACWEEVMEAVKLEDLVAILTLIKAQYESYLSDLLDTALTCPVPPSFNALKQQYDSILPAKQDATSTSTLSDAARDRRKSENALTSSSSSTLDSASQAVSLLEKEAGEALREFSRVQAEYHQAKDQLHYITTVGRCAQRWRGKAAGRAQVHDPALGNELILETDQMQRKILDAIAIKDATARRQRRLMMTSTSFYGLQTLVTEAKADCERIKRRMDVLDSTAKDQRDSLSRALQRHVRPESELEEVLEHIERLSGYNSAQG